MDVRNINFQHYNNLLEQVDITKSIGREHSGEKKESESFAKFLANSKEKSKSMIKQDLDIVLNSIEIIWSKTKWFITITFGIIVISIILIISLKIRSIVNKRRTGRDLVQVRSRRDGGEQITLDPKTTALIRNATQQYHYSDK